MSNNNEGLSRDALIEKAAAALVEYDEGDRVDAAWIEVTKHAVEDAVDAVLTAVADEAIGEKQPRGGVTTDYDQGFLDGWDDHQAAVGREVRALLSEGGAAEAKSCGVTGLDPCPWHPDGGNHPGSAR